MGPAIARIDARWTSARGTPAPSPSCDARSQRARRRAGPPHPASHRRRRWRARTAHRVAGRSRLAGARRPGTAAGLPARSPSVRRRASRPPRWSAARVRSADVVASRTPSSSRYRTPDRGGGPSDLLELGEAALHRLLEPVSEPGVQLRPSPLRQRLVGRISDEDVPESERVVGDDDRDRGDGAPGRTRLAEAVGRPAPAPRAATARDGHALETRPTTEARSASAVAVRGSPSRRAARSAVMVGGTWTPPGRGPDASCRLHGRGGRPRPASRSAAPRTADCPR